MRSARNALPPIYAGLVIIGFLISTTLGTVVLIGGAILLGAMWSTFGRGGQVAPATAETRSERAERRAERRRDRRS
jgi:hypothetical protein